jgi:glutathione S-transferase
MSDIKPLKIWTHASGPNPWKVVIILEELGLPYEHINVNFADIKSEPYISVNPNGRVPALRDPNNGDLTLWEVGESTTWTCYCALRWHAQSGAIIDYLIDVYDKEGKLSYTSGPEKYHQKTWEHFQMSGQGPYFGQWAWFLHFAPEKIPLAIERYKNEIIRVTSVIELHLVKQGTDYLVGDRVTYADLMFVSWYKTLRDYPDFELKKFEKFFAWTERLFNRPSVVKAWADKEERTKKFG